MGIIPFISMFVTLFLSPITGSILVMVCSLLSLGPLLYLFFNRTVKEFNLNH